jgi:predicted nucleic-acid-binding Zn-ribbon protein
MSRGSGFTGYVRFCPKCGVSNLERDTYRVDRKVGEIRQKDFFPEFICNVCGFAFMVKPSLRWEHALGLFKRDRKLRPNNTKFNIGDSDGQ